MLLVEDDESHAELVCRAFARHGKHFALRTARSLDEARTLVAAACPDIVLADWRLADGEATDLLKALDDIPVVVMTSQGDEQVAVEVLKAGALDYIVKSDTAFFELPLSVERAYRESQLVRDRARGQERLRAQYECIRLLANATRLEEGLQPALTRAAEHLEAAAAELWLPSQVPFEIRRAAVWVQEECCPAAIRGPTCQIADGWLGEVWRAGREQWLEQLPPIEELDERCASLGLASCCVHPVVLFGEQLGLLLFFGTHPRWATDPDLCTFVGTLSVQVADFLWRFRLQQELIEQERLAALGTTAAVFAHEVGNPLNNMYLHAQILGRRLQKLAGAEVLSETVEKIVSEMRRLTCLLEEFRALSRKHPLVLRPIALARMLHEVVETHVSSATNIAVHWDLAAGLPAVVGDRDKLVQVFLNLCKNAVEAMPEGGDLTLRARANDKRVVLEVRDTGPGIPDGLDIFQPFKTTKVTGTGLGLPIVRQILAAHGGTVSVSSGGTGGTVFTVTLPLDVDRALE